MAVRLFLTGLLATAAVEDKCGIELASSGSAVPTGEAAGSADVLVLGAGAAGIFAAKRLAEAGASVIVLEGDSQVGGRVRSVEVAGRSLEKGANWVQGLTGNVWWDLVQKHGITGGKSDWEALTLYTNQGEAEDSEVRWDDSDAAVERMGQLAKCTLASNESDFNVRVGLNLAGWRSRTKVDEALVWFNHDFEFGSPPAGTSLVHNYPNPTYVDFEDADFFLTDPRGARHALVQELAASGLEVKLNTVASKVHYGGDKVVVEVKEKGVAKHYSADQAIMTFSVGVLEHDLVAFEPPLPGWKRREIQKFEMAKYLKVYVAFNESVFPSGLEHTVYADDARGRFPYWLNLNLPKFGGADAAPFILTSHVTGFEAERLARQPKSETIKEVREVLSAMMAKAVPEPVDLVLCDWATDPLFMGMYSNWPVGMTVLERERMRQPLGRLWFAGEAYSEKYNGYVHGAILNGNETAAKLLACRAEQGANCSLPMTPAAAEAEPHVSGAAPRAAGLALLLLLARFA